MRNLKKILALVLALVMSLSLMAVASADDELNLGDVSDVYAESIDVLTGLKVFMGNKGEFLPKDNITRAEVAAIIYRIVTGDVADAQKGIYADYNKFSDVTSDAWYAGYVNYCANAEYVKGVGYDANGKAMFKPQQNVTGYEALAMILRAIGYDRNNEFTGPSWQIQTAATARNRGILKNIAEGTLGTAATREAVAEILCQTILVPVADYSLAFGYRTTDANGKDNETLAYKTFKMEKIAGVVVANEYANLETTSTLGANQTKIVTENGPYTLDVVSDLDVIGESRYVYVRPAAGSTRFELVCSKVYEDEALNKIYETNDKADISDSKFASTTGMSKGAATEQYLNFGDGIDWKSDWRVKYVVSLGTALEVSLTETSNSFNQKVQPVAVTGGFSLPAVTTWNVVGSAAPYTVDAGDGRYVLYAVEGKTGVYNVVYEREFEINKDITPAHQRNIERIFNIADRLTTGIINNNVVTSEYIRGEVYVGTTSVADISDTKSFEQFKAEYIKADEMDPITANEYGNWLKVIDNNNDGVAEYILKTVYTFAQVTAVDADGKVTLDTHNINNTWTDADAVNNLTSQSVVCADELAVGNVVYYALIDGKAQTYVPEMVTTKFDKVDRNALTATTADGTTYHEGGVHSHSTNANLEQGVARLSGTYTYDVYLTRGGHLGVFTHNPTSTWTLLTNGWYDQQRGGVEYAGLVYNDENGQQIDTTITANGSMFIGQFGTLNNNWNAIKALGGSSTGNGVGALNNAAGSRNDEVLTAVAYLSADGALVPVDRVYNNRNIHMIDLGTTIPNSRAGVTTGVAYNTAIGATTAYDQQVNGTTAVEVRPLSTTVYYYVYPSNNSASGYVVDRYVGFANAPSVSRASDIEDVYAVASLTSRTSSTNGNVAPAPYYTAEVVVVELSHNYRQRGEQIFVYDMPSAGTSITRETINYIDSKGAVQTAEVDLAGSNLGTNRNYLSAYGKTITPGLYYKYPTTTEGVYTIEWMTYAEIAANNYVVGQSLTQNAINRNNYVEIDAWTWNDTDNDGNKDAGELARSNSNPEYSLTATSGIYRLGYTNDAASAVAGGAYKATLETCGEADDLTAYLGERVDVTTNPAAAAVTNNNYDHTPYDGTGNTWWNNNDLLIAYSGNSIVYAISFKNLTSNGGVNFAQYVWQEAIPATAAPTDGIIFYGAADNDGDKTITVDWATAIANQATPLTVPAGMNYSITPNLARNNVVATTYTLTNRGNGDVYTLIVSPADNVTDLRFEGIPGVAAAATYTSANTTIQYPGNATTLAQIQGLYNKVSTSTYTTETWKFFDANGKEITDTNTTIGDGYYAQVTITPQDTTVAPVTYTIALSGETDRDAADRKVAQDTFDGHNYTLWSDGTNVYESETEALAGVAATGKYSWTVAGFSLPSVVAGLVNRDLTGTGYTSAVQANGAVPAFPTADDAGQVARGTYDVDVKLAGDTTTTYVTKDGSVTVELHFVNKDARTAKTVIEETLGTIQLYLTNNSDATEQPRYYISKTHATAWDGTAGTDYWQGNADTAALTNVINPALETAGVSDAGGTGVAVIPGSFGSRTETTSATDTDGNTVITYTVPVAIIDRSTAGNNPPTDTGVHATVTYSVTYINFAE